MERYESVNCLICNSDDLEEVTDKGQFGFPTHVSICRNCGLSFLSPRWDKDTYMSFYATEYDKFYRKETKAKTEANQKYSYSPIIDRKKTLISEQFEINNVLDIGSGDGAKLIEMKESGIGSNLFAIEASAEYEEKIKNRGIHFISNDIDSDWDKAYESSFDFIIMRHVLEHFSNPESVLKKIRNVLKPNGLLYIAVPNSLSPKEPLKSSFFRVVHTYYFNKISLRNLLHKCRLEDIVCVEGDELHNELFAFAKRSENDLPLVIEKVNFEDQYQVFREGLGHESSLSYRFKEFIMKLAQPVVVLKKKIFPNPIIKKK